MVMMVLAVWAGLGCAPGGARDARPAIALEPSAGLDFGNVPVGGLARRWVKVRNLGPAPERLHAPELEAGAELRMEGGFQACGDGAPSDPSSLAAGGCSAIEVIYVPASRQPARGTLRFATDREGILELPVRGAGTGAGLEVCTLAADDATVEGCTGPGGNSLAIDFGRLAAGTSSAGRAIRVADTGAAAIAVGFADVDPTVGSAGDFAIPAPELLTPPDPAHAGARQARVLQPGESAVFHVRFTPRTGGLRQGAVRIEASDPSHPSAPSVNVLLGGEGTGPGLCLDPDPLADFGSAALGSIKELPVRMGSCGTEPLAITALTVAQTAGGTGEFGLGVTSAPLPVTLLPGDELTAVLSFSPAELAATPDLGTLTIASSDAADPIRTLPLSGQAVAPPACRIDTTPVRLDFGLGAPGGTPPRLSLAVTDAGELPCTITRIALDPGAAAAAFTLVQVPALPVTLAPRDPPLVVSLEYRPADLVGPDQGALVISSDDPVRPQAAVPLAGTPTGQVACVLTVSPAPQDGGARVLDFGTLPVGSPAVQSVSLVNSGTADCQVTRATFGQFTQRAFPPSDPSGFSLPRLPAWPVVLPPRGALQLPVQLLPRARTYAPDLNELFVLTDEPVPSECSASGGPAAAGCKRVGLSGAGVQSGIAVVPSTLDLGGAAAGCSSPAGLVRIYALGGLPVKVRGLSIAPDDGTFRVTGASSPLPATIPAGGMLEVAIRFRPADAALHAATLRVDNDATCPVPGSGVCAPATASLVGQGAAGGQITDTFQEPARPAVDVLMVVDNSGSMADKQAQIASNAALFLSIARSANADFQIAVIGNQIQHPDVADVNAFFAGDPILPGVLFGHPGIIRPGDADPVAELAQNARIGTCCSDAQEAGLEAARLALTLPLIGDPAANAGLLRPDARLEIVEVSDEDDQSPMGSAQFYADLFRSLKPVPSMVGYAAVVGEPAKPGAVGCSGPGGTALPGTRYIDVAEKMGGIWRSICAGGWGTIAQDLALDAFSPRLDFPLSTPCNPATLTVTVNGAAVEPGAQGGSWAYDAAQGMIHFAAESAPPPGATIVARYQTVCLATP
jgi:hypothetical protein